MLASYGYAVKEIKLMLLRAFYSATVASRSGRVYSDPVNALPAASARIPGMI
jgi:hypothetical protein